MKVNKTVVIILTLVLISNIFAVESENFNFPQIKLYQIRNPGPPPVSGPHTYIQTNPFQVYMSEIISTSSTVLSGDEPSDLPINAVICAGEVNIDVNLNENIQTNQMYLGMSAHIDLNGIQGMGCNPSAPGSCCAPPGTTNNLKIVFDQEGINRYYSTSEGCFADVYPTSSGCYYNSFNDFLNQLTNVRFYPKQDETINYPNSGVNVSLICQGNLKVYIDGALFYNGPIEDYSNSFTVSEIGTHVIDINLDEVKCLYFSKRYADGQLCTNSRYSVITKYCLPSQGSTNCIDNLFRFNPSETLNYQFIVADPQIEINNVYVTDGSGSSPIVINPGETQNVIIHLFLNRTTMPFNITNIIPNNHDFIFTPDTPYNIEITPPGSGPGEFLFIVEGTLEASLTYTPGDEINFILYFDTTSPYCNDPINEWEVEVPIIQGPDLIASLTSPLGNGIIYARERDLVLININTSNIGSLNTENTSTTILRSDVPHYFMPAYYEVPNLNPRQSQINTNEFTCPVGVNMNITFTVCADVYNKVKEINENNNCGNLTIVCESQTNLRVRADVEEIHVGPLILFRGPCIVNETQTINISTYSNGICSENSSWTNVVLRRVDGYELDNTDYSVPPLPNTNNPNLPLHAPHRAPNTGRPFGDTWGTCIDFATALTAPFSSVTHEYSYLIEEEEDHILTICADSRFNVMESREDDNCVNILLECVPPEPVDIDVFCTDLEIEEGGSAEGEWGVLYNGDEIIINVGGVNWEGSVIPNYFPISESTRIPPNYIKRIKWNCGADSYRSTYTIFANWTDPTGIPMYEEAECTVTCGFVWYCPDYL
ncbi:hypothetical protein KO317_01330 [Candidatus Micrarchaeota archaeon]|nr:hypothetical protein [Candidatus Micrarchaeota archaeon]